jgi:hypothetical protein
MGRCESEIKTKGRKHPVACGKLGIRYRVRLPAQTEEVPLMLDYTSRVGRAASVAVETVLCPKHRREALDHGMEVIPV